MKVMMMIWGRPGDHAEAGRPETDPGGPVWAAYTQALIAAGVMAGGDALAAPETALTLRIRAGVRDLQDGPYPDTKEQFGGYYLFDVADIETALEWAARCPAAATGAVELRRVLTG